MKKLLSIFGGIGAIWLGVDLWRGTADRLVTISAGLVLFLRGCLWFLQGVFEAEDDL